MSSETSTRDGAQTAAARRCILRVLYIKDVSFENPHAPGSLIDQEQPALFCSVDSCHESRGDDQFDVVLAISLHATAGDQSIFLAEVKQGGLFEITGYAVDEIAAVIETVAVEALYPYAYELINTLAGRGGFDHAELSPASFAALFNSARKRTEGSAQARAV